MGFNRNFRFLMGVSESLTLVKFSKVPGLVESGGFFRRGVDISGNLRLMDLSEFPRFWFGVKAVYYRAFLLVIRDNK